jgi:SAM-dependent methyltransferase
VEIRSLLSCPFDRRPLSSIGDKLACEYGHAFAIEEGVPIFSDHPRREPKPHNMAPCVPNPNSPVDPFVNDWIVNTNGNLYWQVRGRLPHYPIPPWPGGAPVRSGAVVVDLGCGWGRWAMAAARAGYKPIGIDIHIDALQAGVRVSGKLGLDCGFVCNDIDHLPFGDDTIDCVFSYSVLQHMDRERVLKVLTEAHRILKPGGTVLIQLPNAFGLLSLAQQLRRGFREAKSGTFEMRYWSPGGISKLFQGAKFEFPTLRSDGFFSQNPQVSDLPLLSPFGKIVVRTSEVLARVANAASPLTRLSDSLWAIARKSE